MALDENNVIVAQVAVLYVAPVGTPGPESLDDELDALFQDAGYLSEQSIQITPNIETTKLRAQQDGVTVRVIQRGQDITVVCDLIEASGEVAQQLYWGDGAEVEDGGAHVTVSDLSTETTRAVVIDIIDGSKAHRIYLPKATKTTSGQITLLNNDYQRLTTTLEGTRHEGVFCEIWHETDGS